MGWGTWWQGEGFTVRMCKFCVGFSVFNMRITGQKFQGRGELRTETYKAISQDGKKHVFWVKIVILFYFPCFRVGSIAQAGLELIGLRLPEPPIIILNIFKCIFVCMQCICMACVWGQRTIWSSFLPTMWKMGLIIQVRGLMSSPFIS